MQARALRFAAPYRVEIAEVAVPEPGPGDVLVRAEFSGISGGTEMLAYRGEIDPDLPLDETLGSLSGTFQFPFRYGYSCVGRVERSRSRVREGELVFAFHPHQDLFVCDAADAIELGGLPARPATLFPLVETAVQVSLDAGAGAGTCVAVIGLGAVGILSGAMIARSGAMVLGSDPLSWRREAARSFGIAAFPPEGVADAVGEHSNGAGVGLVVEASGSPSALSGALALLGQEGVALVVSWYGAKPVCLALGGSFHRRRLSIRSSQVSSIPAALAEEWSVERRRAETLRLLAELPLSVLASDDFPFEEAAEAYGAIDRGREGLIHAALAY
jgi:2-desacetyl-2-hydroxyethyl bacteriochlorophyllide A dehydrogenase